MRRAVTRKILFITALAMLVFASFSVVIINYLNIQTNGENLIRIHEVYANQVEDAPTLFDLNASLLELPKSIRVTIADESGNVIADSVFPAADVENIAQDTTFQKAVADTPKTSVEKSKYFNSQEIAYATTIVNKALAEGVIVVRTSMSLHYDSQYFVLTIPILLIVLAAVMVCTFLYTNAQLKSAMSPLVYMQESLEQINKGVYHQMDLKSKYRDVQKVIDEINIFSSKISNSVDYLNYEQKKSGIILDNMSQGIIALSASGNMVLANKSALSAFGTTKNVLGCRLADLIDDDLLLTRINDAIVTGKSLMFERNIGSKIFRIEVVRMNEEWNSEDNSIATMIMFTDITQESQSAEIRSEFFANASHELKTPLTAVKGFSELLPQMPNKEARDKCASEITKNTDRMLGLIDDMLKLSKMDANVVDENAEVLNLREMADTVIDNVSAIAIDKKVSITVDGNAKMYGCRKQIEEVMTNLIDNAIKYNVEGGSVKVNIYRRKDKVFFTVEDTGIGIDSIHQSRIFERFYRVDKGRNRNVQSTGLGLAIVKHIVLQHSGKISVESKLGKGTRFTVSFPGADE